MMIEPYSQLSFYRDHEYNELIRGKHTNAIEKITLQLQKKINN